MSASDQAARAAARAGRRLAATLLHLLVLACAALLGAAPARAQGTTCDDPASVTVRRVLIRGNHAFSAIDLENAIVTTPTGRVAFAVPFLGPTRCIDRTRDLPLDRVRLIVYYRDRGYRDVAVDTAVERVTRSAVDVTFRIREGLPVRVDSLVVRGVDSLPPDARRGLERGLPLRVGDPFDRYRSEATRDTLARRLRNEGYPYADVVKGESADLQSRRARLTYTLRPGPRLRIGRIALTTIARDGSARAGETGGVRRLLGVRSGQWFDEQRLLNGQRALYQTETYQRVEVRPDTAVTSGDSTIDVRVTLYEGFSHAASVGGGVGTVDCGRVQGAYTDRSFGGVGGRLDLTARVSKIGVGQPLSTNAWLVDRLVCRDAKLDPFSDTLNYYVGATYRPALFARLRTSPTLTLYSERTSEYQAFLRSTPVGGVASITTGQAGRLPVTFSYELARRRTQAEPALFCTLFNYCTQDVIDVAERTTTFGALGVAVARNRTDDPLAPTRGSSARLEFRHSSALTLSDSNQRFNKIVGDAAVYLPVSRATQLALRLQVGAVTGTNSLRSTNTFIPPGERLYAGGPTTVRGFGQNELGPSIYTVNDYSVAQRTDSTGRTASFLEYIPSRNGRILQTVPAGGNAVAVANVELRTRSVLPELLQFVAFLDAGQVWTQGFDRSALSTHSFLFTPGTGVRVFTPVGPVRIDIGYNGYPRLAGPVYWASGREASGKAPLFCVSPGNTIPTYVDPALPDTTHQQLAQQTGYACPATFRPPFPAGFFHRLTFNFSIGQAF